MLIVADKRPLKPPPTHLDDLDRVHYRWFAVRVGFRKEKFTQKYLEREQVECFVPLRERPFHYSSKTVVRLLPVLPNYVFVRIIARQTVDVLRAPFVFGFVKIGQQRRQVTQDEIDLLRRLSTDDSLEWVVEDKVDQLCPGQLVEICRGSLAGVRGHYINAKTKKVFIISLGGIDANLMTFEVSPDDVIPLEGDAIR